MPNAATILLTLKVLVSAVTLLYAISLYALIAKNVKLHGRINSLFFILTIATVLGFELLLRLGTDVTSQFSEDARKALRIHLCFSIPAAILLPIQFVAGIRGWRKAHIPLGILFTILWIGTFITGVIYLPHE
jgi:hypothetical protein